MRTESSKDVGNWSLSCLKLLRWHRPHTASIAPPPKPVLQAVKEGFLGKACWAIPSLALAPASPPSWGIGLPPPNGHPTVTRAMRAINMIRGVELPIAPAGTTGLMIIPFHMQYPKICDFRFAENCTRRRAASCLLFSLPFFEYFC